MKFLRVLQSLLEFPFICSLILIRPVLSPIEILDWKGSSATPNLHHCCQQRRIRKKKNEGQHVKDSLKIIAHDFLFQNRKISLLSHPSSIRRASLTSKQDNKFGVQSFGVMMVFLSMEGRKFS